MLDRPDSAREFEAGQVWSLWEIMVNFQIFGLCHLLRLLVVEENNLDHRIDILEFVKQQPGVKREADPASGIYTDELIADQDIDRLNGMLKFAIDLADKLELQAVRDRIERFSQRIRIRILLHDCRAEIRALREAFEDGVKFKYFYKYPQAKASLVLRIEADWKKVFDAFLNRPWFAGGSNFQIGWSHDEQNHDEQDDE